MQFSSILFFRWFSTTAVQPLSLKPVSTAQIGESDKPIYVSHFYAFVSPGCVTLLGSVWMLQSV